MGSFSEETIDRVWDKAQRVDAANEAKGFRKDQCGAWILRSQHGNRNSDFGWEIDHITTVANGGGDDLANLRPLHWKNNLSKSSGNLVCVYTSSGPKNVSK